MKDLAGQAKERLQSLFSTTPAGSNAPPVLPPLPVQHPNRDDASREPSVRSPTELGSATTNQQLVELITRLTSKEGDGEKPRTKEAEPIKLNDA